MLRSNNVAVTIQFERRVMQSIILITAMFGLPATSSKHREPGLYETGHALHGNGSCLWFERINVLFHNRSEFRPDSS